MLTVMHTNTRNVPVIDRLIGAKVNVDKQGKTPLMVAAHHPAMALPRN